ncbi:MAG: cytochrome c biogenesis heme-transporting ATPase CcmA [Pseudomonadales bacterium]|nr:cytochrome c biogenesis heme-transporting ATPase CcmA [Pseudomonadales bacterium]
MLKATDLYCERDDRVLFQNLDLELSAGQVLQIQGSNGSGKSTLLRVLCGLNTDYRGTICWQGTPVDQVRADYCRGIFYLGHAAAIKKILSPVENLRWFCAMQGTVDEKAIKAALSESGLRGYDDIPCFMLSAGQQRRVSLARLHLSSARLWLLDEPFTALDHRGVGELESFLTAHVQSGGAVILTTHHPLQMACEVRVVNLDDLALPLETERDV